MLACLKSLKIVSFHGKIIVLGIQFFSHSSFYHVKSHFSMLTLVVHLQSCTSLSSNHPGGILTEAFTMTNS